MNSFKKILVTSLIFVSSVSAQSYQHMSTAELEAEVEQQSIAGTLPFEMGLELIKRWQKVSCLRANYLAPAFHSSYISSQNIEDS